MDASFFLRFTNFSALAYRNGEQRMRHSNEPRFCVAGNSASTTCNSNYEVGIKKEDENARARRGNRTAVALTAPDRIAPYDFQAPITTFLILHANMARKKGSRVNRKDAARM